MKTFLQKKFATQQCFYSRFLRGSISIQDIYVTLFIFKNFTWQCFYSKFLRGSVSIPNFYGAVFLFFHDFLQRLRVMNSWWIFYKQQRWQQKTVSTPRHVLDHIVAKILSGTNGSGNSNKINFQECQAKLQSARRPSTT